MPDAKQKFFDPRPESVGLARDFAVTTLTSWGLHGPADDIRLCVSELATNALIHGNDPGHGFLVRLDAGDDFVRLEVHDSRPLHRSQPAITHPAETDTAGRGLQLIEVLSDRWGIEDRRPRGKIVWTLFKAGQPGGQARAC
ncbi:ATP-binding protein [Streptomyces antarcticus]|uniref:ATP-binding protein n=1 Tax=Streptomyces antarcticus TaxID=2996458 RepID=UPI0022704D9B|nr:MULTISPECIES: ATP-binding protein [unclassified Streptomyces]MCY0943587.1 ATP-binding protein [Streptomyces sp. H34-AA3]MCZ4083504.1 ATP-binding protein [Streptomyces sp. H34-S5]